MRKRLCGLALTLLLALTVCSPPALAAEPSTSPAFRLTYQWNGTQLAVTVSLANNPGIAGYDITLTIDGQQTGINPVVSFDGNWSDAKYGNANWMTKSESESGNTLRVLCVTAKDVTDATAALFTVTFENGDSNVSTPAFSVSGTVATASMELLEPAAAQCKTHLKNDFHIYTQEGYAVITTYGNGYHGKLRLIVAAHQNGKFLGCQMTEVDLVQDSEQELIDFELRFFIGSSDEEFDVESLTYTLLVLDEHFVPIVAPILIPCN